MYGWAVVLSSRIPKGSKYPTFKDSGPKCNQRYGSWNQESFNIGYLDSLGSGSLLCTCDMAVSTNWGSSSEVSL